MYVCVPSWGLMPPEADKREEMCIRCPWTRITGGYDLPYGCWELAKHESSLRGAVTSATGGSPQGITIRIPIAREHLQSQRRRNLTYILWHKINRLHLWDSRKHLGNQQGHTGGEWRSLGDICSNLMPSFAISTLFLKVFLHGRQSSQQELLIAPECLISSFEKF